MTGFELRPLESEAIALSTEPQPLQSLLGDLYMTQDRISGVGLATGLYLTDAWKSFFSECTTKRPQGQPPFRGASW